MPKRNSFFATLIALVLINFSFVSSTQAAPGDILASFSIRNISGDGRNPTTPHGITFHNGFLWISDFGTDRIYRVYPIDTYDRPGGTLLFRAGDSDFNIPLTDTNVPPVNSDGQVVATCGATPAPQYCGGGGLTFALNYLWNASPITDDIIKIDPVDGDNLETENALASLAFPAPTDITFDGTNFWISDWQQNTITRVRPEDGAELGRIPGPSSKPSYISNIMPGDGNARPYGLTWDGEALWVADRNERRIYRVSPIDGSILDHFPSPGTRPHGLGWDGDTLWHVDPTTGLIYQIDSGVIPFGLTGCLQKNGRGLDADIIVDQLNETPQSAATDFDGCFHFPTFRSGVPLEVRANERGLDEKPVITLVRPAGSETVDVTIELGGTYVEPGFTAIDTEDGNISHLVTATPNVINTPALINTRVLNSAGIPITYRVVDSAGNAADPKTRRVFVVPVSYRISGTVNGLRAGQTVQLSNNSAETISVSTNGGFSFANKVIEGQPYNVRVAAQPTGQTCSVVNGVGTATANVTNVVVNCTDITYNISVNAFGLEAGDTLVVSNNARTFNVTSNGTRLLETVIYNSSYHVQINTPPTNKTCNFDTNAVTSGNALSNITLNVRCSYITYTLGGTLSGLEAGDTPALRLESNAQLTTLTADGAFTLNGSVNSGANYLVVLNQRPTNKNCTLTNNSGVARGNVSNIVVTCIDNIPPAIPTVNTLRTNNSRPVITGTAAPIPGDILSVRIGGATYDNVSVTGGNWSINTATATPSSGTFTPFTAGTYDIIATMRDAAGNSSTDTTTNELSVDLTAPVVPTVDSVITNATIPGPITGTATLDADETLRVVVNGATYNNIPVSAGRWSLNLGTTTPSSGTLGAFNNGSNYNVVASVIDSAGNVSTDTTTNEIVIDRTPPATPALPDMTAATDTGASNTDNITANTRPDFVGTCSNTDVITLHINGANSGVSRTCTGGNYLIAPASALADGNHAIRVTATDLAGNVSALSPALNITIVTSGVTVPTVTPLITNNTRPTLTGGAILNAGASLEVSIGSAIYRNVPVSGNAWSLNTATAAPSSGTFTALADGRYNVVASITDTAGNMATDTTTNELTIDTVPPAVPTVNTIMTNDLTPSISGTAALAPGDVLTVSVNGATYDNVPTNSNVWIINTGLVTPSSGVLGTFVVGNRYEIIARVRDAAGNISTDTTSNELAIGGNAPGIPDMTAASDSGSSNSDNITSNARPTFTGTCSNGTTITLYVNGSRTASNGACSGGIYNITLVSSLTDGGYNISATSTSGSPAVESAQSSPLAIQIDTTPPTVLTTPDLTDDSDTGISSTDNITRITTPSFAGNCVTGDMVRLFIDGAANGSDAACVGSRYLVTATAALAEGVRNIRVAAIDLAGNESARSAALNITIDTTPPPALTSAPDLTDASDSGASSTDNITSVTTPTFVGTCAAGEVIVLFVNGSEASAPTSCNAGTYTITTNRPLSNGSHVVTASRTDIAGNPSPASPGLNITISTGAPAALGQPDMNAASDTGVSSTDNITQNTRPMFSGFCTNGHSIQLFVDNSPNGAAVTCTGGSYSLTPANALNDGNRAITVRATDLAGNVSAASAPLNIVIDTVASVLGAPDLIAASDSGVSNSDNITNITTPTFSGACSNGDTVRLFVNGNANGAPVNCSGGIYNITATALASGTYAITVSSSDLAGNTGPVSPSLSVTIDTILPAAPTVNNLTATVALPTLTGTATLGAGETLSVSLNGATYNNLAVSGNAWSLNLATTTPSSGSLGTLNDNTSYNVTATVSDIAGNARSDATTNELRMDHLTTFTLSLTGFNSGTNLIIREQLNGGATSTFNGNGTRQVSLPNGVAYRFAITTQPSGQVCRFPASTSTPPSTISGSATADATIAVLCQSTNMTFSNTNPVNIPGSGSSRHTLTSTLNVPQNVQIADLNLYVNMNHTWVGDVSIRLTSPTGTSAMILERPGTSTAFTSTTWLTHPGCRNNNIFATFDDEGTNGTAESACNGTNPAITGNVRPNNPLRVFDGQSSQGTWTLTIYDSHPSRDGGTLNEWRLNVTAGGL